MAVGYCATCRYNRGQVGTEVACTSRQHAKLMDMAPTIPGIGRYQQVLRTHHFMALHSAESCRLICPSWERKEGAHA
uniref:Uncharacterized protein n=1 Tax=viral metagenome TaxID=1070528 RepID=A0A6H2A3R8_9ZZZZ